MGPVGQLVPFNLDAMVTFNCTVSGVQLIWQINSAQLVTPEDMDAAREIGIFPNVSSNPDRTLFGTLRINVSESNQAVNTTRIGCLAVGSSTLERDVSDFVELLTFGEHHCLFPFTSRVNSIVRALECFSQAVAGHLARSQVGRA